MSGRPDLSVVIPCHHDEQPLRQLLAQLDEQAIRTGTCLQVIVVDAGDNERCRALCRQHGAQWIAAVPCRGEQLRLGARLAQADGLWFLHADAVLTGDPLARLGASLAQGAAGGYFAFRFVGGRPWQARMLERLIGWRNRIGVPYGDQGIFARRDTYEAAGGHAAWPLFEEVPLVRGLRRAGRFQRIPAGLLVDPRRWQRDGWWRRSLGNRLLALGFMLGIPPRRLAERYASPGTRRHTG